MGQTMSCAEEGSVSLLQGRVLIPVQERGMHDGWLCVLALEWLHCVRCCVAVVRGLDTVSAEAHTQASRGRHQLLLECHWPVAGPLTGCRRCVWKRVKSRRSLPRRRRDND